MPATQHTRNGTWILPTNAFSGCHKGAKSHGSCRKTMSVSSTLLTAMQHELLPRYIPKETDISLPPDEVLGRACEGYVLPWATLELARPRGWATFPPIKSRRAENAAIWLAKRRAPVVLGGRGHAGPIGMREAEAPSSHWLKGSSRSRSGGGGEAELSLSHFPNYFCSRKETQSLAKSMKFLLGMEPAESSPSSRESLARGEKNGGKRTIARAAAGRTAGDGRAFFVRLYSCGADTFRASRPKCE